MFGFSLHIIHSPGRLVVVDPIFPVGVVVLGFFMLTLGLSQFLIALFGKVTVLGRIVRVGFFAGFVVGMGVALAHSSITLDAKTNSATIENTYIYRHTRQVVPLSEIDHAQLGYSRSSSAVQLVMTNGSVYQMSNFTQQGNMNAAVFAINQFLESHGRQQTSYQ